MSSKTIIAVAIIVLCIGAAYVVLDDLRAYLPSQSGSPPQSGSQTQGPQRGSSEFTCYCNGATTIFQETNGIVTETHECDPLSLGGAPDYTCFKGETTKNVIYRLQPDCGCAEEYPDANYTCHCDGTEIVAEANGQEYDRKECNIYNDGSRICHKGSTTRPSEHHIPPDCSCIELDFCTDSHGGDTLICSTNGVDTHIPCKKPLLGLAKDDPRALCWNEPNDTYCGCVDCEDCTNGKDDDGDGLVDCDDFYDCYCQDGCKQMNDQSFMDYINEFCPDVFTPTNINILPPIVQPVDNLGACGRTSNPINLDCSKTALTIEIPTSFSCDSCGDPCGVAKHEMHHVYHLCAGQKDVQNSCKDPNANVDCAGVDLHVTTMYAEWRDCLARESSFTPPEDSCNEKSPFDCNASLRRVKMFCDCRYNRCAGLPLSYDVINFCGYVGVEPPGP